MTTKQHKIVGMVSAEAEADPDPELRVEAQVGAGVPRGHRQ